MAQFETSFIPKKQTPTTQAGNGRRKRGGLGLLGFIALIIFLFSLVGTGGLYLYKIILENRIDSMAASIARVQEAIDPELIENLRDVDGRLETSKTLLSGRTAASPIFNILEERTLTNVGYNEFRYNIDQSGVPVLQLSGSAEDYSSLALQSDIFGELQTFEEPLFENLRLDEKGNVTFSFETPIARSLILFENNLEGLTSSLTEETLVPSVSGEEDLEAEAESLDDLDAGLEDILNGLDF